MVRAYPFLRFSQWNARVMLNLERASAERGAREKSASHITAHSRAVGRMTMLPTSTSGGCSSAKRIPRAMASGEMAMPFNRSSTAAFARRLRPRVGHGARVSHA